MKQLILIIVLFLFISCEKADVTGIVVGKSYKPSYSYMVLLPIYNGDSFTHIPQSRTDSEKYILVVQDSTNHEILTDRETFDSVAVGDSVFFLNEILSYKKISKYE